MTRATLLLSVLAALGCAASACAPPAEPEGPVCTEPTPPPCQDALIEELSLVAGDPSPQDVVNTARGDGFHSEVDARAGGLAADPRQSFLYLRFTPDGLERVAINDAEALESMDWDIGFHRYVVRLNGGTSGPSCVAAAPASGTLDEVTSPPSEGFIVDSQLNGDCEFIAELEGESQDPLNERDYASALGTGQSGNKPAWWVYPGCVETTGTPFVIRRADRSFVKMEITHFYNDDAQTECNETGFSSHAGAANFQIDWAFIEEGT